MRERQWTVCITSEWRAGVSQWNEAVTGRVQCRVGVRKAPVTTVGSRDTGLAIAKKETGGTSATAAGKKATYAEIVNSLVGPGPLAELIETGRLVVRPPRRETSMVAKHLLT